MAKPTKKGRSRADLQKQMSESKMKFKSATLEEMKDVFTPSYYLDTGSAWLNIMIGGRYNYGMPNCISMQLVGEKDSGKSLLGMLLCAAADNSEFLIDFYESEGAALYDKIVALGINPDYFNICDVPHINGLKLAIYERLKFYEREDLALIYVDSIGNMPASEEYEKAEKLDPKMVMGKRAIETNGMFRVILKEASRRHVPMIFVNRQYKRMDLVNPKYTAEEDKNQTAGGTSNDYSPSITLRMSKKVFRKEVKLRNSAGDIKKKMIPTGTLFTIASDKNRICRSGSGCEMYVDEEHGMSRWHGIAGMAEEFGYLVKNRKGSKFNETDAKSIGGWTPVKCEKYKNEEWLDTNDIPDDVWVEMMESGLNDDIYNNYYKLPELHIKFNKQWNAIEAKSNSKTRSEKVKINCDLKLKESK